MTPATPPDLACDPELAPIEILDAALDATVRALLAAHPQLTDCERPHWLTPPPPSCDVARSIADVAEKLRARLADYRAAIDAESSEPDDAELPF